MDLCEHELFHKFVVKNVQENVEIGKRRQALESALALHDTRRGLKLITSLLSLQGKEVWLEEAMDCISEKLYSRQDWEARQVRGGTLLSFGRNDFQLGYRTSDNRALQTIPKRVDFSDTNHCNIVQVSASTHHTVAVDAEGRVWVWGLGLFGRLGVGDDTTRILPTQIASLASHKVTQVAAGKDHSLALTSSGLLFSWGSNEKGQLGIGSNLPASFNPKKVKMPRDDIGTSACSFRTNSGRSRSNSQFPVVVNIAASATHSVAVDSFGRVFSWGCNDKGQLGCKDFSSLRREPKLVQSLVFKEEDESAIKAVCSDGVTFVLTTEGNVLQFGRGSHAPFKVSIQATAEDLEQSENWNEEQGRPGDWRFGTKSGKCRVGVVDIACGPNHAAAISSDGHLYTWGSYANLLGHVGKGCDRAQQSHTMRPMRVAALKSAKIVSVACGKQHTCAVDSFGNLYSWGIGADGALGTTRPGQVAVDTYQPVPQRVTALKKVTCVSAADTHTVCVVSASLPAFKFLSIPEYVDEQFSRSENLSMPKKDMHEPQINSDTTEQMTSLEEEEGDEDEDESEDEVEGSSGVMESDEHDAETSSGLLSLQDLCQTKLAKTVDIWNVLSMWEFANCISAPSLQLYCEAFVAGNLDAILVLHGNAAERISSLCGGEDYQLGSFSSLLRSASSESTSSVSSSSSNLNEMHVDDHHIDKPQCESFTSPDFQPAVVAKASTLANNIKVMPTPRLRKRLESCKHKLEAVEDKLFQLSTSTPESGVRSHRKKATALEVQRNEIEGSISLIENELRARKDAESPGSPAPEKDPLHCTVCQVRVHDTEAMVYHVSGKRHRKNQARLLLQQEQQGIEASQKAVAQSSKWQPIGELHSPHQVQNRASRSGSWTTSTTTTPQPGKGPSVSEIQQRELDRKRQQLSSPIAFSSPSSFAHSSPVTPLALPGRAFPPASAGRGVSLSDFVKPDRKKGRSILDTKPAWDSASKKDNKRSSVLEQASILKFDLSRIQEEQLLEKSSGKAPKVLAESRWGFLDSSSERDKTLAEIQHQQSLEMESERLARELAAMEGLDQSAIMERSNGKTSRQNSKPRHRKGGNEKASTRSNKSKQSGEQKNNKNKSRLSKKSHVAQKPVSVQ